MAAPNTIYLQVDPEGEKAPDVDLVNLDDVTWCQDRINDNDIKYVLEAKLSASEERVRVLSEALETLLLWANAFDDAGEAGEKARQALGDSQTKGSEQIGSGARKG